jgi:thioredoxin 1
LENELKINNMKRVLYFSTAWCGPCKTFKPVVQQVSQETGIPVTYIDADQDKETAQKYSINSVPTIVIVDSVGSMLYRNAGIMPKGQLSQLLRTIG